MAFDAPVDVTGAANGSKETCVDRSQPSAFAGDFGDSLCGNDSSTAPTNLTQDTPTCAGWDAVFWGSRPRATQRLGTAHSSPSYPASSRPAVGVPESRDAPPSDSSHSVFCAERVVGFGCCHSQGCTAKWLRREGAVGAGRSRRPRRMRICGAGSTRIHQTEMERPAIGAAATERWSGRGPGMRHGVGPLTASEFIQFRRASRFSSGTFTAYSDGTRAV